MTVILEGTGRLAITFATTQPGSAPAPGEKTGTAKASQPKPRFPDIDLDRVASVEEALFVGLLILLQTHHKQTAGAPTRRVLAAAIEVCEELVERGDLPPVNARDNVLFAKLLVLIEELFKHEPRQFLDNLGLAVRRMLLKDAKVADDDENGDPPSDDGETERRTKRDGNNGTPGKGGSGNGTPSKGGSDNGTPGKGGSGNGTPGQSGSGNGTPGQGTPSNGEAGKGTPGKR